MSYFGVFICNLFVSHTKINKKKWKTLCILKIHIFRAIKVELKTEDYRESACRGQSGKEGLHSPHLHLNLRSEKSTLSWIKYIQLFPFCDITFHVAKVWRGVCSAVHREPKQEKNLPVYGDQKEVGAPLWLF